MKVVRISGLGENNSNLDFEVDKVNEFVTLNFNDKHITTLDLTEANELAKDLLLALKDDEL